jgi:hypothetical protein
MPVFEDEGDQYEIGADSTGIFIVVPGGLSALWVVAFLSLVVCRAILGERVFTEAVMWQGVAFACSTFLGCLLVCAVPLAKKRIWNPHDGLLNSGKY